jgi:CRISPR-associated endonuclease Cas1
VTDVLSVPLAVRDGLLVLWGYGVSVSVSRGHLVCIDGVADERRTIRIARADRPKRIVVVVESGGHVSFDAIRWLVNTGTCSLVLLSRAGVVLSTIGPRRLDDSKLRRAQALAPYTPAASAFARYVLRAKLEGQADVLRARRLAVDLGGHVERIMSASSVDEMLVAESAAAVDYWKALSAVPVSFARRSQDKAPERWQTFGQRASPIGRGNRRAVTLGNAMLNFTYAVLESQVTLALASVGLDPGLGIIHADKEDRASFSLDVLEALRPVADRFVFDTIARRTFSHEDAVELDAGDVRLAPRLAVEMARSATFSDAVAFVVSQVVALLESSTLPVSGEMLPGYRKATGSNVTGLRGRGAAELRGSELRGGSVTSLSGPSLLGRPRRSTKLSVSVAAAPKYDRTPRRHRATCAAAPSRDDASPGFATVAGRSMIGALPSRMSRVSPLPEGQRSLA